MGTDDSRKLGFSALRENEKEWEFDRQWEWLTCAAAICQASKTGPCPIGVGKNDSSANNHWPLGQPPRTNIFPGPFRSFFLSPIKASHPQTPKKNPTAGAYGLTKKKQSSLRSGILCSTCFSKFFRVGICRWHLIGQKRPVSARKYQPYFRAHDCPGSPFGAAHDKKKTWGARQRRKAPFIL